MVSNGLGIVMAALCLALSGCQMQHVFATQAPETAPARVSTAVAIEVQDPSGEGQAGRQDGTGTLSITVRWPSASTFRAQAIPGSATRVEVALKVGSAVHARETIVRNSGESSVTKQIRVRAGTGYSLEIEAYPAAPYEATQIAQGTASSVNITAGATTAATVTLSALYAPTISAVGTVTPGSTTSIAGANFLPAHLGGAKPTVTFARSGGGTTAVSPANVTIDSNTSLTVLVPSDAANGNLVVTHDGLSTSGLAYTVEQAQSPVVEDEASETAQEATGVTLTALNQYTLNNGKLRFGAGTEGSVNALGNLLQPWYKSPNDGAFYKLTYSSYPLVTAIGAGTGGSHWTGSNVTLTPAISGQVVTASNWTTSTSYAGGFAGWGILISRGDLSGNTSGLQIRSSYTLGATDPYLVVRTRLTNTTGSPISNIHFWVGTQDDWIGNSDGPTKTKGKVENGAFVALTNQAELAPALRITSGAEAVIMYSATPNTNFVQASCCSFQNAYNTNPTTSPITQTNDGSYGLYWPVGTILPGEYKRLTWFYGAGAISDLAAIITQVANAADP